MMYFSDIHDNALFPFRTNRILRDFKHKYPFNKPLGINTKKSGVETYLNSLVVHIEEHYLDDIISNLHKPLKMDPLTELAQLQFYEETSMSRTTCSAEEVCPNEIFYSLEQLRQGIFEEGEVGFVITDDEKANKIHNSFIHDKMLFDSFNAALHQLSQRKPEPAPWQSSTNAVLQRKFTPNLAKKLLSQTRELVLTWNNIEAGATKPSVPEPVVNNDFGPPGQNPNEEDRNQQIEILLTKDIHEDNTWTQYED